MKIPYKYAVALTASLGLFMAVLDNTIVNVALTPMARAFNTDLNAVQWVITAYFLAQAAVIPAAGYLSTRLGIKNVFIVCLAFFTIGSLFCGLSDIVQDGTGHPYIALLVFFRVLQGIGGGALFPLATAIAFSAFPPAERASSSAIVAIPVLMAPSFGPTIGGLLIDSVGWQWIFFINVPVGMVAIYLMWRIYRPETENRPVGQSRFDFTGLVLSMLGIVAVVYGFTVVSQRNPDSVTATNPTGDIYGWGYWVVWAWVGAGVALLLAFVIYELRTKDPVVDLRLFREREFTSSSIMTWALRAFIFGSFFLIPVFLENIRNPHLSATVAGLATMPMGLASAVAIGLTGRKLYALMGPRYLVLVGMLFLAGSNVLLLGINNDTDGWSLIPAMILRGIGFGMTGIPLQTLALEKLKGAALPKASSLYNASAQIFSSIGVAVLTTFFVQQTTLHRPATAEINQTVQQVQQQLVPGFLAQHPGLTPATIQSSPAFPQLQQQVQNEVAARITAQAGVPAITDVFMVVTIAMVVLVFLSFILPDKSSTAEATEGEKQPAGIGME
ncbi:MAG TPA: DHA2 family efflux MFS transporter permease subunit [Chloroflexia bacterium]|nr:DHA2 family efflux MFS transporter permease subunit [Chloroflexia bacterium]